MDNLAENFSFNETHGVLFCENRGVVNDGDMSVLSKKVSTMQSKLNKLRETEENLDRLYKAMRENYKHTRRSPTHEFFAYVTRDDLLEVFGNESVILTVRNCDTIREGTSKVENSLKRHTLRVKGRWKADDVRLVTTDGDVAAQPSAGQATADGDAANVDSVSNEPASASQPEPSVATYSRRPGRRRKPERIELKEDDGVEIEQPAKLQQPPKVLTPVETEQQERRITAETLLGYRPPYEQQKRHFEEDWLESRYKLFDYLRIRNRTSASVQFHLAVLYMLFPFRLFISSDPDCKSCTSVGSTQSVPF